MMLPFAYSWWLKNNEMIKALCDFKRSINRLENDWGLRARTELLAYEYFVVDGKIHGKDVDHWLQAELVIKDRLVHDLANLIKDIVKINKVYHADFSLMLREVITKNSFNYDYMHTLILTKSVHSIVSSIDEAIATRNKNDVVRSDN